MGYSEDAAMVRVDFFKETGKWAETEAVRWVSYNADLIHNAFRESLRRHLRRPGGHRMAGMTAVCLEPYHKHSHPLMVSVDSCFREDGRPFLLSSQAGGDPDQTD